MMEISLFFQIKLSSRRQLKVQFFRPFKNIIFFKEHLHLQLGILRLGVLSDYPVYSTGWTIQPLATGGLNASLQVCYCLQTTKSKKIQNTLCRCYGNASPRKRLTTEMPQKPLLRNFRFILGNPSKLEKGEGFPNIFEAFPNI